MIWLSNNAMRQVYETCYMLSNEILSIESEVPCTFLHLNRVFDNLPV